MAYAFGCNSSDDNPSSASEGVAAEGDGKNFCDHTIGALSGAFDACCTASDQASPEYDFSHGLVTTLTPICTAALEGSIARQRVRVHPADTDACYAAYAAHFGGGEKCKTLTTTYLDPAGPSCRNAFSGVQGAGAPCGGDHECQDGLTCVGYTSAAEGVCQAPPPIGAPCGPGRSDGGSSASLSLNFGAHPKCATGAYCASASGMCVARVPAGQKCQIADDENTDCAELLHCHMGTCGTEGPADVGGACVSSSDCTSGHYCAVSSGTQSGQCAEFEPAGGTCKGGYGFQTECKGRCDADGGSSGTCATFCGSE